MKRSALIAVAGAVVVLFAGCQTPIGVNRVGMERAYEQITASALTGTQLSAETQIVFARYGLAKLLDNSPDLAIAKLQEQTCRDSRTDQLFALAEASFAAAKRYESYTWVAIHSNDGAQTVSVSGKDAARAYYLASTLYSYFFLFGDETKSPTRLYDRHFRTACDFYNRGLSKALTKHDDVKLDLTNREFQLPVGSISLTVTRPKFPFSEAQFHEFVPADEYAVRGISPRERTHGLGAPLIAIPDTKSFGTNWPSYYQRAPKVPATAFLRINGSICDMTNSRLKATLELYSTFNEREIKVGQQTVPLETDLTTMIAYNLQHSVQWKARLAQFFTGNELIKSGVYLTQPYERGKIPVVFVYGTAGSPSDWAAAINILWADPAISSRYQFWYLVYNTGNPIAYSGWILRSGLDSVVKQLDPAGADPALRKMVVIGHSQGGLVTKLAAVDSGDKIWSLLSDKPIETLGLQPADRELLGNCMIFEHSPYVKRVVLACAPNLGSIMVNNLIEKLAQLFIRMPRQLTQLGTSLATLNLGQSQSAALKEMGGKVPTSVANMNPGNPFLLALHDLPLAKGIKGDTIIAVCTPGPVEDGNDTVVAYKSAYLPGMQSVNVVHCDHGDTTSDPVAIEDIRQILLMHLRETGQ
jgi:pimeloyl-ACP methyl ester carboxylesterase